jgi:hypothetical protein
VRQGSRWATATGRGRPGSRGRGRRGHGLRGILACAWVTTAITVAGCAHGFGAAGPAVSAVSLLLTPVTRALPAGTAGSPAVLLLAGGAQSQAAQLARKVFTSAPVVVVAAQAPAPVRTALAAARTAHAPLLLTPASARTRTPAALAALAAAIRGLHPQAVLVAGLPPAELAARLPGVSVVASASQLPASGAPDSPQRGLAVLVPAVPATGAGARSATALAVAALAQTARAAGAAVVPVTGTGDPRGDPRAITTLARSRPRDVIAVGDEFAPVARLTQRVDVAVTGIQLPGGGQVVFPGRRLVALYGHPGTPGLGALGQQDLAQSVTRARQMAALYRPLSPLPVVPTFELIATVAEAAPGPDGTYSHQTPVADLRPWVQQATAAGMYVVLDLQPGRASLLTQAQAYQSLLELPNVGLALDPEWKLQPGQRPLKQIGHVGISEVNGVVRWLAALTQRRRLPQKLLVLHQFQLQMIRDEPQLDTSHDDLAILIHMDGQGTPGEKEATWDVVTGAAPRGVFFGWKNFLVKDHPMLTPAQTMTNVPAPVMISYQ